MTGSGSGCTAFEEALSARLDAEDHPVDAEVLAAHLARCPSCRAYVERAEDLKRLLRVRPAESVPDLTQSVLAAIPDGPAPKNGKRSGSSVRRSRARVPVAAGITVVMLVGAYFGGKAIADHNSGSTNGVVSIQQVTGSTQTSRHYPGATVLVNTVQTPNVALTDTAGQSYNVAGQTTARVTLVYFGYTHCPDVCPINMALTAEALQDMPAKDRSAVRVVFITTDPTRDTPPVIRAWLDHFGTSFVGLTGTPDQVHQAERDVGMPLSYAVTVAGSTGNYQVIHAGYTLVYTRDGNAHLTVDDTEKPTEYATTLEHLVADGYQGN